MGAFNLRKVGYSKIISLAFSIMNIISVVRSKFTKVPGFLFLTASSFSIILSISVMYSSRASVVRVVSLVISVCPNLRGVAGLYYFFSSFCFKKGFTTGSSFSYLTSSSIFFLLFLIIFTASSNE